MPKFPRQEITRRCFCSRNEKQSGGSKQNQRFIESNLIQLMYDKREFLVKTFANLIVQLGITYYVMEKTPISVKEKKDNTRLYILAAISFITLLIMILVPMPSWTKFLLFTVLSYICGLLLSVIKLTTSGSVINMAIQGSIGIFAIMFAFGSALLMFGVKLGYRTGMFLLIALLILILAQIVFIFGGASSVSIKLITYISLLIFSAYIIYDTNKILQRNYYGDFITASLDYYLDILNIFVDLITLGNGNN